MIGDAVGKFQAGDLYILGSGLPHLFAHREVPPEGAAAEVLQFHPDLLEDGPMAGREMEAVRGMIARAAGGLHLSDGEEVGAMLREIRRAEGVARWTGFFRLWERLLSLDPAGPLAGPEYALGVDSLRSESIQRVCGYLLTHFQEEIRMEEMARMAHYSPAAFSRTFKQATRRTFTEFLAEVRLGHACALLRETDWPVLRISLESGFQNLSNFNRRFRNRYAISPREYRNQVLNGNQQVVGGREARSRVQAVRGGIHNVWGMG